MSRRHDAREVDRHHVCIRRGLWIRWPAAGDKSPDTESSCSRVLYENRLSIVLLLSFLALLGCRRIPDGRSSIRNNRDHDESPIGYWQYFATGHFVEATAENWESEFLQMAAFVWLAVHLRQKGSPESKPPRGRGRSRSRADPNAPARRAGRKGGCWLKLYSHSLTLAFLLMFVISFLLHAAGGAPSIRRSKCRTARSRSYHAAVHGDEPSSGSSRCRTGRASSSRSRRW